MLGRIPIPNRAQNGVGGVRVHIARPHAHMRMRMWMCDVNARAPYLRMRKYTPTRLARPTAPHHHGQGRPGQGGAPPAWNSGLQHRNPLCIENHLRWRLVATGRGLFCCADWDGPVRAWPLLRRRWQGRCVVVFFLCRGSLRGALRQSYRLRFT